MTLTTRPMTVADADAVLRVYAEGIATGDATFRAGAPGWPEFDADHLPAPRRVAEHHGSVAGWAALTRVSGACAYAGVAEVSVYVAAAARGRGLGRALLGALVEEATVAGMWTLQASVFPENAASLALHEHAGFRVVGTRERIGLMTHGPHAGSWRDTVLLERRAP